MGSNKLNPDGWVERYADYLYHYTITRIADREAARDLVQETFASGLKSAKNFKGKAAERTWLVAILKRKIIDYYRRSNSAKGKAEINMTQYSDSEQDWLEDRVVDQTSALPGEKLENEELGLAIQDCISRLPYRQARAFKLKTLQNWRTEDICKEMRINPSNLWVMVHRARTALMECLNQNWFKIH